MSIHRQCGQRITWIRRPNGTYLPPFEFNPYAEPQEYVLRWQNDGWEATPVIGETETHIQLRPHDCPAYDRETFLNSHMLRAANAPADVANDGIVVAVKGEPSVRDSRIESPRIAYERREAESIARAEKDRIRVIRLALKLKHKCVTCNAKPFEWCTYVNREEDEFTKQLHTNRGPIRIKEAL